ncbi:RNA-guided pseudouridylation complex pseudouridine synthase subunit Cbf5 [Candidatus Woesearchaeota archaeon]|nr:RNA-guided pseudouridylation complex pseudouridine synthase subunit Cbf5 [Candidatus Woesearchaeota archaeon]
MESLLPFEKIKREVFIRKHAETSPKFGKRPEERTTKEHLHLGIVNIDKPAGPTSHQISGYVRQMLHLNKAGHSGTLDPNVTGVLPVALGDATKVVQALLPAGKEYICIMHLHDDYSEEQIRKVCASFIGKIKQLPPLKSAVKREWRYRKIYYLDVLEVDGRDVLFRVGCQAGTYIRKLCADIGIALGSNGHMQELRRTKAGCFSEDSLCTMHDLADAFWYWKHENNDTLLRKFVFPLERAVGHLPKVWVFDTTVDSLCHGASLKVPGISKVESDIQVDDFIAIMSLKDELVAFGKVHMISKDIQKKDKGLAVKVERVFMSPGVYPKMSV